LMILPRTPASVSCPLESLFSNTLLVSPTWHFLCQNFCQVSTCIRSHLNLWEKTACHWNWCPTQIPFQPLSNKFLYWWQLINLDEVGDHLLTGYGCWKSNQSWFSSCECVHEIR
jgi:hypothetical protein